MMNKQIALISVIGLVLSAAVGFGAYAMLHSSTGHVAGETAVSNKAESPAGEAMKGSVAQDEGSGLRRPACPSLEIPGAQVQLQCLSEHAVTDVDKNDELSTDEKNEAIGGDAGAAGDEITVVNVWAWWCQPCREEIPYLQEVQDKHPEWQVVGVHADKNAKNGAGMLDEMGVDFVSYQDSHNTFASELGLPGVIPITIVYVGNEQRKVFVQPFRSTEEIIESIEGVL